jgi:hypothetical protein
MSCFLCMSPDDRREFERLRSNVESFLRSGIDQLPAPRSNRDYRAFTVYPAEPGPLVVCVAHFASQRYNIDLLRDDLTVDDAAIVLHRFGIKDVVAGIDDDEDSRIIHAVAGCLQQLPQFVS